MAHYHKIGLLSLFFVMAVINSNATDYSPHDYSVIPPSPEVSALMQDVEIPVSLFSGLPDIEIPICTVTEGTIEIPVTISYNGGGIKVEELPGIIGMGWHLNAGGCVSRSINGLPDELNTGEYGYHGLQHLNNGETTFRQRLLNRDPDISYTPFSRSDYRFPDSSTCQRYNNGLFDVENDLYRFNFNGHKGTFFINNDVSKSLVVSSSSPVFFPSITGTSLLGSGGSFSLGNDNGVEYYFNDAGRAEEKTLVKYEHLNDINWNSDSITTAWFLTKMKSAANDSIMFEYIPRKIIEYHGFSQSHIIFSSTNDYHGPQHQFTTSTHSVDYRTCLIKRISTPTTIVLFDYNNDTLLTSISLYRRTSPQELVKRWELTHSEITVGFKHNNNNTSAVKKPFLSSIVEKGATEQDDIVLYKFDYNTAITDYDQNVNYAYAQDHWGYYNGKPNTTLVIYDGADREPDEQKTKIGVLTSITYPTGGKVTFDWELNDFSFLGQSVFGSVQNVISEPWSKRISGFTNSTITQQNMNSSSFDKSITFTVSPGHNVTATMDLSTYISAFESMPSWGAWFGITNQNHGVWLTNHYCENCGDNGCPRVKITKANDTSSNYPKIFYVDSLTCSSVIPLFFGEGQYTIQLLSPVNFDGVDATVINSYFGPNGYGNETSDYGFIKLNGTENYYDNETTKRHCGGLRISKISTNTVYNTIATSYKYTDDFNDTFFSSGTILEHPVINNTYESTSYVYGLVSPSQSGVNPIENITTITSYSSHGLFSTPCSQSHVEYPIVWEYNEIDNNRISYHFSSQREIGISDIAAATFYGMIPATYRINTSLDYSFGNLLNKVYYNGSLEYKREEYQYSYSSQNNTPLFCGKFHMINDMYRLGLNTDSCYDYTASIFRLIPFSRNINARYLTETRYDAEDNNMPYAFTSTNEIDYFTDESNPNAIPNRLVKYFSKTNSDGTISTTYYTYYRKDNVPRNLPETIVEVCEGKIINARYLVYNNKQQLVATYAAPTGISVTQDMHLGESYQSSTSLLNAINLPEYTYTYHNNRLIEIAYNGEVLSSFLWSYKGFYPIAEIRNTSFNDVCSAISQNINVDVLYNKYTLSTSDQQAILNSLQGKDVVLLNYDLLSGITSVRDARGNKTSFTRDTHQRLSSIVDVNNHLIRKYDYHYSEIEDEE